MNGTEPALPGERHRTGTAGFEPERDGPDFDPASLGRSGLRLAGLKSEVNRFAPRVRSSQKRWALPDLNRSQRVLLATLRGLPLAGLKSAR